MLGHEIGVIQALGFFKHVFAENTFIEACGRDARHVVHVAGINRLGKLHHVARAFDVHSNLAFGIGRQVIHRGQVINVVDAALERLDVVSANAQLFGRQVTAHGYGPCLARTPVVKQRADLALTARAHQKMHCAATARQKCLDQTLANKTRGAGDEVMHVFSLRTV